MEDGVISLDKDIEDLTLDRPPSSVIALGVTEPLTEDIFKDVPNTEIEPDVVSSRLATCLIDKPLVCQTDDQDVSFDPLSSSERNDDSDEEYATIKEDITGKDNGLVDDPLRNENNLHSADVEQIQVLSSSVHSVHSVDSTPCLNRCSSKTEKLVSCLKSNEDTDSTTENNNSKSVRFTDGPEIVTEYIEPVNPWKDRRTPTKCEVISIYKNACKKLKCKHLEKVVKQIQEAPDLSNRSGTLILRGCRLDNKSCEALESVFNKVQFENLDLENCSLEEDGATAVLEMIEFYHSTCKLNIACNPKVGLRGWQALCRMLRKTPCLTYLDARRTILTEMTMPAFGRCLKADPYLKVLHLEGVFLSGRPLLILTTALKYNTLLEELYLGDNDLTSNDGPSIGTMLTINTTLQLLDLRNNQIKDIGLAHIGNGLSDQTDQPSGGLCSLIMWNNGLTHEGMSYLCEGLVKTTTLKALNLGQNRIGDLGVQKLKGGLMKNKSLRKLGFLNTKLGSEGAVALAEVLADSWSITRIDIRENNIQTAGLMAFAMALKVNQSLLRLDLDKDIRKEPGMETVMQSVLVDIYNLCHRNKNLVRKNITPSQSASSCSIGTVVSRQSSTSSEMNEPFSYEDVFHPEEVHSEVTPFSPSVCIENPLESNTVMFSSINSIIASKMEVDSNNSTESLGNPVPEPFDNTKRGRAYSDPIKNNPDPPAPANVRRNSSRFSVTKIVDMLGTHAQGVASKIALKKQQSREKVEVQKTSEILVLNPTEPVEMTSFGSQPSDKEVESTATIDKDVHLDCIAPTESVDAKLLSNHVPIATVDDKPSSDDNFVEESQQAAIVEFVDSDQSSISMSAVTEDDIRISSNASANEAPALQDTVSETKDTSDPSNCRSALLLDDIRAPTDIETDESNPLYVTSVKTTDSDQLPTPSPVISEADIVSAEVNAGNESSLVKTLMDISDSSQKSISTTISEEDIETISDTYHKVKSTVDVKNCEMTDSSQVSLTTSDIPATCDIGAVSVQDATPELNDSTQVSDIISDIPEDNTKTSCNSSVNETPTENLDSTHPLSSVDADHVSTFAPVVGTDQFSNIRTVESTELGTVELGTELGTELCGFTQSNILAIYGEPPTVTSVPSTQECDIVSASESEPCLIDSAVTAQIPDTPDDGDLGSVCQNTQQETDIFDTTAKTRISNEERTSDLVVGSLVNCAEEDDCSASTMTSQHPLLVDKVLPNLGNVTPADQEILEQDFILSDTCEFGQDERTEGVAVCTSSEESCRGSMENLLDGERITEVVGVGVGVKVGLGVGEEGLRNPVGCGDSVGVID